jgi:hypothetical protein
MKAIKWEEKRWDWNTKSRWEELGYQVNDGAESVGTLKTEYSSRRYPLYSFAQVTAIATTQAYRRRWLWNFERLRYQAKDHGKDWVELLKGYQVSATWNKDKWDDAIYDESIKIESDTYTDRFGVEMSLTITQREALRGDFEKAALAALEREYSSYPYGVGIL